MRPGYRKSSSSPADRELLPGATVGASQISGRRGPRPGTAVPRNRSRTTKVRSSTADPSALTRSAGRNLHPTAPDRCDEIAGRVVRASPRPTLVVGVRGASFRYRSTGHLHRDPGPPCADRGAARYHPELDPEVECCGPTHPPRCPSAGQRAPGGRIPVNQSSRSGSSTALRSTTRAGSAPWNRRLIGTSSFLPVRVCGIAGATRISSGT